MIFYFLLIELKIAFGFRHFEEAKVKANGSKLDFLMKIASGIWQGNF